MENGLKYKKTLMMRYGSLREFPNVTCPHKPLLKLCQFDINWLSLHIGGLTVVMFYVVTYLNQCYEDYRNVLPLGGKI